MSDQHQAMVSTAALDLANERIATLRKALGACVAALEPDHGGFTDRGECGGCDAFRDGQAALEATKGP